MKYLSLFTYFGMSFVHAWYISPQSISIRPSNLDISSLKSSNDLFYRSYAQPNRKTAISRLNAYTSTRNGALSTVVSDISDFASQVQLAPTIEAKVQVLKDYSAKKRAYSPSASDQILSLLQQHISGSSVVPSLLIADYLWGISNLGISNRNPKHRAFITSILHLLSLAANALDATAVSRCFVALYRLEVDFSSTSNDIKSSLLQMITNHSIKFKALQVVNVIFAMSKMKIQFSDLSPAAQNGLTKSIMREQAFIMRQEQLMNMLVYGVAVCNYPLSIARNEFQRCVTEIAYELLQQSTKVDKPAATSTTTAAQEVQHLANTIYALGKLGLGHVKYDSHCKAGERNGGSGGVSRLIWQGVSSMLRRMKDHEVTMTIHG